MSTETLPRITGTVADPEFRHRRAVHAARSRHSKPENVRARVDRLIDVLVEQAPPLTDEQRARLRSLLAPRPGVA